MPETLPPESSNATRDYKRNSRISSRSFWVAVFLLAFATLALAAFGSLRSRDPSPNPEVEINLTVLEVILSSVAMDARATVENDIDAALDTVYAPAYDAIPAYVDFHYSVFGEYVELAEAATGQMSEALYARLFDGFEERMVNAADIIDKQYVDEYTRLLRQRIDEETSLDGIPMPLGKMTEAVVQDAIARAHTTVPLATVAAGVAGSGSLRAVSAAIGKKLAAKIASKAAAKGLVKGGSMLTGASGGALLCWWTGPGAVLCGIAGGTAAWFLTDAVIINIDEFFSRDEFEAELRAMLDEDRAVRRSILLSALADKAKAMDEAHAEIFRMRDLQK